MNSDEATPTSRAPQRRRLWPWLAAAASGGLLAICFPPVDAGGLAFLALGPLLWAVWKYRPVRRPGLFRFLAGWVCGMVFFSFTFWWISELAPLFTGWLLVLPVLLAVYLALFPAIWAWFAGWIVGAHFRVEKPDPLAPFSRPPLLSSVRNLGIALVLAAAWTALEWVRGWLFTGFGWNALGVALYAKLELIQIAEFTGVGGPTFLLVLCNAILVITVLRLQAEIGRIRLRPHFDFALTIALLVIVFLYGGLTLRRGVVETLRARQNHGPILRVAAVQPNIPQPWKFGRDPQNPDLDISDIAEKIRQITARHHLAATYGRPGQISFLWDPVWGRRAAVRVLLKPQLVIWPEASLLRGVLGIEENWKFVQELMATTPALLLGTDDSGLADTDGDHNSAALFLHERPEQPELYHKTHLVPFGEYLPMRWWLGSILGNLCPGDFMPGRPGKVFVLPNPGVKLGPLVCFEDTDGDLARKPVQNGAQILVNITNDGWFGKSGEPLDHLENAIFRAVENRRPLVRCGNTAMTCAVDAYGQVDLWAKSFTGYPVDTRDAIHDVPYEREPRLTFYTRYGEVFSMTCSGVSLLVLVATIVRRRKQRTLAKTVDPR